MRAFNEKNETYCIIGEAYAIKDYLKEQGYFYNPILGWHGSTLIELPPDYKIITINFNEIYAIDEETNEPIYKDEASVSLVKEKIKRAYPKKNYTYYQEEPPGTRIYNITAKYIKKTGYQTPYGWMNIFSFEYKDHLFVWFTKTELNDIPINSVVDLTATIKNYDYYKGIETTKISRAVIKLIS